MSLSHYQRSQLRRIEASLRLSDPKPASMLGTCGRRCAGQRMPTREQAPSVPSRTPERYDLSRNACNDSSIRRIRYVECTEVRDKAC